MSDQTELSCATCTETNQVQFCRDCARLTCAYCLNQTTEIIYTCPSCLHDPEGEVCGGCGSSTEIEQENLVETCPSCDSRRIQDPEILIDNLSSNYYAIIKRVETVNSEFIDLYRSFDFMVGLVRFCRLGGLYGIPQMEMQLEKCSNAMSKLNNQSIEDLNKIKKEGLYDIRSHNYFKDVKLDHLRSLDGVLQITEQKIEDHLKQVRFWIGQIKQRINDLTPTALFLRKHYEMLDEINRYLPTGVHDVVAIIPPISMSIKTHDRKENDDCYIVFTEKYCVFLPNRAITNEEVVNGIKVPYADLVKRERKSSLLKGIQLVIELERGRITISAPHQVLDKVEQYFGLIDSDDPYMVGSPKKINSIETNTPDKNEYRRAAQKTINIFNEWLFDDRIQQKEEEEKKIEIPSMKELRTQLDRLENLYRNYNYQARHHQIPLEKYQEETTQIKDNYASIKDKLARLSGHFGELDTSFMGQ